jgi:purine-cytosine permease-like protein
VERYSDFLTGFLTTIGMVFVPVYTVLFLDFLLGKSECKKRFHFFNLAVSAIGIVGYWLFSRYKAGIPTLATILLVCALFGIGSRLRGEP